MQTFEFKVSVSVDRVSGKFAQREEIESVIGAAIENALAEVDSEMEDLGPDSNSAYTVSDYQVDSIAKPTRRRG